MKQCYIRMLHAEVHILTVYAKYVATLTSQSTRWGQNIAKKAAAGVSMEKNRKDKPIHRSLVYTKSKKEVTGEFILHVRSCLLAYQQLWQWLRIMDGQC